MLLVWGKNQTQMQQHIPDYYYYYVKITLITPNTEEEKIAGPKVLSF